MAGCALVLEGGGFRGMFTAGVLDVLMEHGIYGFTSVLGVSAGSINACSFKSHQIGRTMRIILAFRDDGRFASLASLARTGDLVGGEFMYDAIQNELDPGDNATFNAEPMRMFAVASDVVFGTPAYLPCRRFPDDVRCVRASASMPGVSKMVDIDGRHYLDGGTTDSIPFEVALGCEGSPRVEGLEPASRALVVITQDRAYRKDGQTERLVIRSRRYDQYPYYVEALASRAERYNAKRERLWEHERSGDCLVIGPDRPVGFGVVETKGEPLLELYLSGRRLASERIDEIAAFVAGA